MRAFVSQLTRFGLVGLIGLVIDVAVFNLLRSTVLSPDAFHEGPVVAKIISTSLAIIANWLGNRHWTFRREHRSHPLREGAQFAIVSIGGMLIALGCLWFSHYVLGFTSALADNVSANVVGLALGTVFRFWLYRMWVFADPVRTNPVLVDAGASEGAVEPAGSTPGVRIKAVAPIQDGAM